MSIPRRSNTGMNNLIMLLFLVIIMAGFYFLMVKTHPQDADNPPSDEESQAAESNPADRSESAAATESAPATAAPDTPTPVPSATPTPTPTPTPPPARPVHITIAELLVDNDIMPTEYDEQYDTMQVYPDAEIISWYIDSAVPGHQGNAILAGHNTWRRKNGALIELDALSPGAAMTIGYDDGTERDFLLESVFVYYLPTAPAAEIMNTDGDARVTVITCHGDFNKRWGTSTHRVVAVFKPAETFTLPDPPIEPLPEGTHNPAFPEY